MRLLMSLALLAAPAAALAQDGPPPGRPHFDPSAIFDMLDANHDGKVTRAEFDAGRAMMPQRRGRGGPPPGASGDAPPPPPPGESAEGGPPPGPPPGGRVDWFARADSNNDGVVTRDEAMAAVARFRRPRSPEE